MKFSAIRVPRAVTGKQEGEGKEMSYDKTQEKLWVVSVVG